MTAHWIKGNEQSRQPNRFVWLAVGSRAVQVDAGEGLVWDGAVAAMDWRSANNAGWHEPRWVHAGSPASLWERVCGFTRNDARTVLMAWDLGEVVRLTEALLVLPAMGWRLERWQVGDRFVMLRWRSGKRGLSLIDAAGSLPMGRRQVSSDLTEGDTPQDFRRWTGSAPPDSLTCTAGILRDAMLDQLAWMKQADLGNWQPTSGSQAWAHWRHRHYTHPVLVHDDERARRAEREAAYAGRCEAWKWGELHNEVWTEWDLPLAYPNVCLTAQLPTVLRGRVRRPPRDVGAPSPEGERWLYHARVKTEVPVLPARHDGGLLWPVGEFEGWWWDDELREAISWGAQVELTDSYRYSAAPALAEWASWVNRFVNGEVEGATAIRRAVVKGWGRALIGRFGTRYWEWEDWGATDVAGIRLDRLADRDKGTEGRQLHVAGRSLVALDMRDGLETAPALMSAVMAACRIRLWRIIQTAGEGNVAYCDTDSVLVSRAGDRALAVECDGWGHNGLRRKGAWRGLEVLGPRQVVSSRERRVSGVPAGASHDGRGGFGGTVTEGLESAAIGGNLAVVIKRPKAWQLRGADRRRVHLPGGNTEPVRL